MQSQSPDLISLDQKSIDIAPSEQATGFLSLLNVHTVVHDEWNAAPPAESPIVRHVAWKAAKIGGWSIDVDTLCLTCSSEISNMLELSPSITCDYKQRLKYYTSETLHTLQLALQKAISQGAPIDCLARFNTDSGRIISARIFGQPERDENGRVIRISGVFQDVGENIIKDALNGMVARTAKLGAWILEFPDYNFYWSKELCDVLEYPRDHSMSFEKSVNLCSEESAKSVMHAVAVSLLDGSPQDIELQIKTGSGRWITARVTSQCELNSSGQVIRIYGALQDISSYKNAVAALQQEREYFYAMLENLSEGIATCNAEGVITTTNKAARDLFGVSKSENDVISFSDRPQIYDEHGQYVIPAQQLPLWRALNGEIIKNERLLLKYAQKELRMVSCNGQKIITESGKDLGAVIAIHDVTERQRNEQMVMRVAKSVSMGSRVDFFEKLACNMAETLGAFGGFVSQFLPSNPGEPIYARTLAAVVDGVAIDNFTYLTDETPCSQTLSHQGYYCLGDVQKEFPNAPLLAHFDAVAYSGQRLDNSEGKPIGLLGLLFMSRIDNPKFVSSNLQIFAVRAAAEIDRLEIDTRLRQQASLLDKAQDAILVRDMDHRILYWNKSAERLYGWSRDEVLGQANETIQQDDAVVYRQAVAQVLETGAWRGEINQRCKDGTIITSEGHWSLVREENGMPKSVMAIYTDVSNRKAAEIEIQKLAFYDPLTGLPNRVLLIDRLKVAVAASARSGRVGALLFIDLDNFKTLNDTQGHDVGDMLLQQVAARLSHCLRENDTVARLGGDEFVVMLPDIGENTMEAANHAQRVGEKIRMTLSLPFQVNGFEHHSSSSIGVTVFKDQGESVGDLLKRADVAMYSAKAAGRNALRFFDPEMQLRISMRAALEIDLRDGLARKQFEVYYEPQVANELGLIGAEALIRWRHPRKGLIPPATFIPLAEEMGLIVPIGTWVLEQACEQLVLWSEKIGFHHLTIAVNVSARQLAQHDFVHQVSRVLKDSGANPRLLKLELTESLLLSDIENTIAKMSALQDIGVTFSLDDFGTGYSSLAYLKRLPLDQLKIDLSFVRDALTDVDDASIVRTIISLAQNLRLSVIAEGVETRAQRDFLLDNGCHSYQGYLYSAALPISEFEGLMIEQV